MTADTPKPTLPLTKALFQGFLTYGVDARALHKALSADEKYPVWIARHIESGNFLENQDFILRRRSEQNAPDLSQLDCFLSLDMAKVLAVLERPRAERTIVRRLLLEAEKQTVSGRISSYRPTFDREIDEIIEARLTEALGMRLPHMLSNLVADRCIQIRYGKTAGQIWTDAGFPKLRGVSRWFGDRLQRAGCSVDGHGYGELGDSKARLFDPDKAKRWLGAGGKRIVEQKILDLLGQGSFDFSRRPARRP